MGKYTVRVKRSVVEYVDIQVDDQQSEGHACVEALMKSQGLGRYEWSVEHHSAGWIDRIRDDRATEQFEVKF